MLGTRPRRRGTTWSVDASKKANRKQRTLAQTLRFPGNVSTAPHPLVKGLAANMQQLPVMRLFGLPLAGFPSLAKVPQGQLRLGWRRRQQLRQGFERAMLVLRGNADLDGQYLGLVARLVPENAVQHRIWGLTGVK